MYTTYIIIEVSFLSNHKASSIYSKCNEYPLLINLGFHKQLESPTPTFWIHKTTEEISIAYSSVLQVVSFLNPMMGASSINT